MQFLKAGYSSVICSSREKMLAHLQCFSDHQHINGLLYCLFCFHVQLYNVILKGMQRGPKMYNILMMHRSGIYEPHPPEPDPTTVIFIA